MCRRIIVTLLVIVTSSFSLSLATAWGQGQRQRPTYTAEELNKYDQIICFWRAGQAEEAKAQLVQIGLEIVFEPPGLRFAACKSGMLTPQQVGQLNDTDMIEFVEPDFPLTVSQEQGAQATTLRGEDDITPETVQAFEHAGGMICFWKQ